MFLQDISHCERIVEYGWILENLCINGGDILDVGSCQTYFPIMLGGLGHKVVGVDKEASFLGHPNVSFERANIFTYTFRQKFDRVTLISTIEHIGEGNDDVDMMQEIIKPLLKPEGKVLITTPYGKLRINSPFRVYDKERLLKLCEGYKIEKEDYFAQVGSCWVPVQGDVLKNQIIDERVSSIVCLKLGI